MNLPDNLMPFMASLASGLIGLAVITLWKRMTKKTSEWPSMDKVASFYLRSKSDVDPAKYYAVVLNLDIGQFGAYVAGGLEPPIFDFDSRDEADSFARQASIDLIEGEKCACLFRGREEYLAVYHGGKDPWLDGSAV